MSQPKCPFCLEKHDFKKSRICPKTFRRNRPEENEEVPRQYIDQFNRVPPIPLVTMGFKGHGKTTYLAALSMVLEDLYRLLPGTTYQLLDQYTVETLAGMRQQAIDKKDNEPSEPAAPRPMFINVYGGQNKNCLVLYDVAGEIYQEIYKNDYLQKIHALKAVQNVLFMVSLSDLQEKEYQLRINDLLLRYIDGMQRLEMPVAGHNLIVVFTKGDKIIEMPEYAFPPEVKKHFYEDPFRNATRLDQQIEFLPNFTIDGYMSELRVVSDRLKEYTRRYVPGGGAFIDLAEMNQIGLYFTITSATGQDPISGHFPELTRYCVLDPYFWALELNTPPLTKEIHLLLDGTESSGRAGKRIYESGLAWLCGELSNYGDVITHYMGQRKPASIAGQAPPLKGPRVPGPRLVGPILDGIGEDSTALALTAGEIIDLNDYTHLIWADRFLLVAFGEEDYQPWKNQMPFREGDETSLILEKFRDLFLLDSVY
jgi:hypothetical protein